MPAPALILKLVTQHRQVGVSSLIQYSDDTIYRLAAGRSGGPRNGRTHTGGAMCQHRTLQL
jgi:hypothetical protein